MTTVPKCSYVNELINPAPQSVTLINKNFILNTRSQASESKIVSSHSLKLVNFTSNFSKSSKKNIKAKRSTNIFQHTISKQAPCPFQRLPSFLGISQTTLIRNNCIRFCRTFLERAEGKNTSLVNSSVSLKLLFKLCTQFKYLKQFISVDIYGKLIKNFV